MGTQVERILFIAIVISAIVAFVLVTKKYESVKVVNNNKEVELNNFKEYDVNTTQLQSTLVATQAVEIDKIWFLQNPVITTDEIKFLRAKRSIAKGGIVEFLDDVEVLRKDGKRYSSQKAFYKIRTKEIITPDKFLISKEYDLIRGTGMTYDTAKNVTRAKDVNGTFILQKPRE